MSPQIGERLGHYRIDARAGEGGMGVVYRAHDMRLGRDVALKFLTRLGDVGAGETDRLLAEARSLAALDHANIVRIYDLGESDGAPYLVLEWVSGSALHRVARTAPCSEAEFLRITLPIAEALAAAHVHRIVHRDLKPANVMLSKDGGVKLLDFGLARLRDAKQRLTQTGGVIGTPAYMSPEQAIGGEVGPASDIFSFGALAYELLTGQTPFPADSAPSTLFAVVHTTPAPLAGRRPDLSPAIVSIVERCLAKTPADRYASGSELAEDLHRAERMLPHAPTGPATAARVAPRPEGCPDIRYCRTRDGASIAYSAHGSGPIIVRVLGWFTHLEMEWQWPALRLLWERLAAHYTVVRYDGRGIGLSSPWSEPFTEHTRQLDLEAVLDAVSAERAILFGISEGGWTAGHFAAAHPERVSHLVIYGSYSRGIRFRPGFDPDEIAALSVLMRKGWGRDTPQYRQIFTTAYFGADADPGLITHFNQLQRAAADGDTAARYQDSLHERPDGTDVFANIRTPTLVIHCRDDQIVDFAEGQRIAAIVPGAQLLPLPTGTHYFPIDDDVTLKITDAIGRFTS